MIDESLAVFLRRLDRAGARGDDYVLFGSTVLYLHGIETGRPVGDVDVFLRRPVWARLLASSRSAEILTPRADDPPILLLPADPPIHVFYDWTRADGWMDVDRCFELAEWVIPAHSGAWTKPPQFRCIPLEELRRHKRLAERSPGREKHESDLELLDARLGS